MAWQNRWSLDLTNGVWTATHGIQIIPVNGVEKQEHSFDESRSRNERDVVCDIHETEGLKVTTEWLCIWPGEKHVENDIYVEDEMIGYDKMPILLTIVLKL